MTDYEIRKRLDELERLRNSREYISNYQNERPMTLGNYLDRVDDKSLTQLNGVTKFNEEPTLNPIYAEGDIKNPNMVGTGTYEPQFDPSSLETPTPATPSTQGSWTTQPMEGTAPTGQGTVYEGGAADTAMKGGVPESGSSVSPLALMMVANMVGKIGQGNQNQMDSMPVPSAPVAGGRVFTPPSVQPSSLLADLNRRKRRSF